MLQRIVQDSFPFSVIVSGLCSTTFQYGPLVPHFDVVVFADIPVDVEATLLCLCMYTDFANSGQPLVM